MPRHDKPPAWLARRGYAKRAWARRLWTGTGAKAGAEPIVLPAGVPAPTDPPPNASPLTVLPPNVVPFPGPAGGRETASGRAGLGRAAAGALEAERLSAEAEAGATRPPR